MDIATKDNEKLKAITTRNRLLKTFEPLDFNVIPKPKAFLRKEFIDIIKVGELDIILDGKSIHDMDKIESKYFKCYKDDKDKVLFSSSFNHDRMSWISFIKLDNRKTFCIKTPSGVVITDRNLSDYVGDLCVLRMIEGKPFDLIIEQALMELTIELNHNTIVNEKYTLLGHSKTLFLDKGTYSKDRR